MAQVTVSDTPNPDARKFTLDVQLDAMVDARSAEDAAGHPVAEPLMAIDGVAMVFGTADFVTVTRTPDADWDALTPAVTKVLTTTL